MQWIGRRTQASRLVQDNGSVDVLASPVIGNAGEPPLPGLSGTGGGGWAAHFTTRSSYLIAEAAEARTPKSRVVEGPGAEFNFPVSSCDSDGSEHGNLSPLNGTSVRSSPALIPCPPARPPGHDRLGASGSLDRGWSCLSRPHDRQSRDSRSLSHAAWTEVAQAMARPAAWHLEKRHLGQVRISRDIPV